MEGVTVLCFSASYTLALAAEVWHLYRPRPVWLVVAWAAAVAGILAHTIYLAVQRPPLSGQAGWLFFIAWILAVFYLYGAVHHARRAWGVFVLPVLVGLVLLGALFGRASPSAPGLLRAADAWGPLHAVLLILATVGVCVAFVASVMYLVQMRRLRAKTPPGRGLRLLSLERLETMNRRAINLAFPLLTAGVLVGLIRLFGEGPGRTPPAPGLPWTDYRVLSAIVLWAAFALLWVLRYGYHLRGRTVAVLTVVTFILLIGCLALSHPVGQGAVKGGTP